MPRFAMEKSDSTWQHQKYASPEMYGVGIVHSLNIISTHISYDQITKILSEKKAIKSLIYSRGPSSINSSIFDNWRKLLLTYLFGHYNLLQVLASAKLRRHTSGAVAAWRQFRIRSVLRFSSTCLAQRWGGRSYLRQPPPGSDSKTLRTGLELLSKI